MFVQEKNQIVVAVDASRNRSGGAISHIKGILSAINPMDCGIKKVHIWSYRKLLDELPNENWLIKHCPEELDKGLPAQLWWQFFKLPKLIKGQGCDILLTTDAGSVCHFSPSIVMSRDMLSFEKGEMSRFMWSLAWLRLFLLRYIQVSGLRKADGALFLTQYASDVIQTFTGKLKLVKIIPHGISEAFRFPAKIQTLAKTDTIKCVYVSNADLYKHQWNVVEAFSGLRQEGYNVHLTLIGAKSGHPKAIEKIAETVNRLDADGQFVDMKNYVPHHQIPSFLESADIFIFASSCENMPNTLIEAMASGLPIACSNRGPMPEVLDKGGVYFDPEVPRSIADAVKSLIDSNELRTECLVLSKALSDNYSWRRCAQETWSFLVEVFERVKTK